MSRIEVKVRLDSVEATFEGEPDDVLKAFFEWLSRFYPAYESLSKIVYEPSLDRLIRECSDLLVIVEGGVILKRKDLTAENAIMLSLVGAYLGFRLGKLEKETMTPVELMRSSWKALKTVYNTLSSMVKRGMIAKEGGEYRLTKLQVARFMLETLPKLKE